MAIQQTNIPQEFSQFYLKDVTFVNLMMRRIYNVLIVANPYDAFMLEDDGRVEEKIYNEYMELGLRYPPSVWHATSSTPSPTSTAWCSRPSPTASRAACRTRT